MVTGIDIDGNKIYMHFREGDRVTRSNLRGPYAPSYEPPKTMCGTVKYLISACVAKVKWDNGWWSDYPMGYLDPACRSVGGF